jgi:hypothetical protein
MTRKGVKLGIAEWMKRAPEAVSTTMPTPVAFFSVVERYHAT